MEERQLGRSGLKVSAIGFGAWGIGGGMWSDVDDQRSLAALRTALEAGCTFIDTALVYGEGHSERLIARALKDWRRRVTVATKVPPKNRKWPALTGIPLRRVFPAAYVKRCAEESAGNLGRSPDLLQLHVWQDEWLRDKDWPALEKTIEDLIAAGTIKAFGISINDHDPASALEAVRRCQLVTSVQVIYNIFDRSPERALFPLCLERKVGVIARVPFDEGGLTGKIGPDTVFPPGDWRATYFNGKRKDEVAARVEALEPLVLEQAGTLAEGALRFCLSHPAVTTVIPGMRTAEHVRANVSAADGRRLTPELLQRLEAHAWERNFYPPARRRPDWLTPSFVLGILAMALWLLLGVLAPLGTAWVHTFLPIGVLLLVRAVVTSSDA